MINLLISTITIGNIYKSLDDVEARIYYKLVTEHLKNGNYKLVCYMKQVSIIYQPIVAMSSAYNSWLTFQLPELVLIPMQQLMMNEYLFLPIMEPKLYIS